ncbi:MAG: hypothetical protein U9R08_06645 [Nanoarchaeota archaeon]|nr:hypothetical protein [Nanoarchaeota archaeon]
MKLKTSDYQGILMGIILICIISGALLLLTDFAGWYYAGYHYEQWGDIYFGSGILSSFLLFIMALLMFKSGYGAIKIIRDEEIDSKMLKSQAKESQRNGIIVTGITFIGGLIFVISNIIDKTEEWWLDTGFFAGIIGGIILILLAKLILDKMNK